MLSLPNSCACLRRREGDCSPAKPLWTSSTQPASPLRPPARTSTRSPARAPPSPPQRPSVATVSLDAAAAFPEPAAQLLGTDVHDASSPTSKQQSTVTQTDPLAPSSLAWPMHSMPGELSQAVHELSDAAREVLQCARQMRDGDQAVGASQGPRKPAAAYAAPDISNPAGPVLSAAAFYAQQCIPVQSPSTKVTVAPQPVPCQAVHGGAFPTQHGTSLHRQRQQSGEQQQGAPPGVACRPKKALYTEQRHAMAARSELTKPAFTNPGSTSPRRPLAMPASGRRGHMGVETSGFLQRTQLASDRLRAEPARSERPRSGSELRMLYRPPSCGQQPGWMADVVAAGQRRHARTARSRRAEVHSDAAMQAAAWDDPHRETYPQGSWQEGFNAMFNSAYLDNGMRGDDWASSCSSQDRFQPDEHALAAHGRMFRRRADGPKHADESSPSMHRQEQQQGLLMPQGRPLLVSERHPSRGKPEWVEPSVTGAGWAANAEAMRRVRAGWLALGPSFSRGYSGLLQEALLFTSAPSRV